MANPLETSRSLFLRREFESESATNVLDIACGGGKRVLEENFKNCIGVNILGYPEDLPLSLGYKDALVWGDGFKIKINYKFDVITIINLNAYIIFDDLNIMLSCIREYCIEGVRIIFINEYNNILYRWMKRSDFFDRYVERCEHWFFSLSRIFYKNIGLIMWLEIEKMR